MNIGVLIVREIAFRKVAFALACAAIALLVGISTASVIVSRSTSLAQLNSLHEREIESIGVMKAFQDSCDRVTRRAGFTHRILAPGQTNTDLFSDGFARTTMPQNSFDRVAMLSSEGITRAVPVLRQKLWWREQKRSIVLCGVGAVRGANDHDCGSGIPEFSRNGTVVVGHELGAELQIEPRQQIVISGHAFIVSACADQKGSDEDITIWTSLEDAQKCLAVASVINECWVWADVLESENRKLEAALTSAIPGCTVVEMTQRLLVGERSRLAAASASVAAARKGSLQTIEESSRSNKINVVIAIACGISCLLLVAGLSFDNLHARRGEIGVLRALGISRPSVFAMFIARVAAVGLIGAIAGCGLGVLGAGALALHRYPVHIPCVLLTVTLIVAPACAAVAGLIPALKATQQDPAEILISENG